MKMLCIRGRLNPAHTGLYAGRVYEVSLIPRFCGCPGPEPELTKGLEAHAEGSVFLRPRRFPCSVCKKSSTHIYVPWAPYRFVPWQPDVVKSIAHEAKHARDRRRKPEKITS